MPLYVSIFSLNLVTWRKTSDRKKYNNKVCKTYTIFFSNKKGKKTTLCITPRDTKTWAEFGAQKKKRGVCRTMANFMTVTSDYSSPLFNQLSVKLGDTLAVDWDKRFVL